MQSYVYKQEITFTIVYSENKWRVFNVSLSWNQQDNQGSTQQAVLNNVYILTNILYEFVFLLN